MFNYTVEKITIRFYKYKILGKDLITIEAFNKNEARKLLRDYIISKTYNLKCYSYLSSLTTNQIVSELGISESLNLPVTGESLKVINNLDCVWFNNQWIPLWEYEKSYL